MWWDDDVVSNGKWPDMAAELVRPEGLVENTHSGTPLCFLNSRLTPALSSGGPMLGALEPLTFKKEHLDFS